MRFTKSHTTERVEQLVLALRDAEQPPSLRVLGRVLGYDTNTVTKYLDLAEARGLIERQRCGCGRGWLYTVLEEAS